MFAGVAGAVATARDTEWYAINPENERLLSRRSW
jgi:hypothetical protein